MLPVAPGLSSMDQITASHRALKTSSPSGLLGSPTCGGQDVVFLSRGNRDIGVAFQSHPVGHTSSRVEGSKGNSGYLTTQPLPQVVKGDGYISARSPVGQKALATGLHPPPAIMASASGPQGLQRALPAPASSGTRGLPQVHPPLTALPTWGMDLSLT